MRDVTLSIARGECHGLMGENGAGKSTLGKSAGGHSQAGRGRNQHRRPKRMSSLLRAKAMDAGVAMVHQELAFCPDLSVAENLCMGRYPRRFGVLIDRNEMERQAKKLLAASGVSLDVWQPMRELSTAQEQLVQIAAAVGTNPRILIFDEPTSSLAEPDAQNLFLLIERLKSRGITTIYVSHRMPELFRLCDQISILARRRVRRHPAAGRNDAGCRRADDDRPAVEEYFPKHLSAKPRGVALAGARSRLAGAVSECFI